MPAYDHQSAVGSGPAHEPTDAGIEELTARLRELEQDPAYAHFGFGAEITDKTDTTGEWWVLFTYDRPAGKSFAPYYFAGIYNDEAGLNDLLSRLESAVMDGIADTVHEDIAEFLEEEEQKHAARVIAGHGNWIRAYEPFEK